MGNIFYIHRLSKLIDEMVKDLGLTLTLADDMTDIKLSDHILNIEQLARSLGVVVQHQVQPNGKTIVVFKPR
jgi:hypothetical protein